MVVPVIFGKMGRDVFSAIQSGVPLVPAGEELPLLAGFVASFVTGLFACTWMIQLVKSSKLTSFAIYCFIVGVLAIAESQLQLIPKFFAASTAVL